MLNLPKLFILVLSLRALSSPLSSDTTDTIAPVEVIQEQTYTEDEEMQFFLEEIMKAFEIEVPDSLNHK